MSVASGYLFSHLFEDGVQNGPEAAGFTCHRGRQLGAGAGDLGVLSFDLGIQRLRLLHSAAAQVFKQSLGCAFGNSALVIYSTISLNQAHIQKQNTGHEQGPTNQDLNPHQGSALKNAHRQRNSLLFHRLSVAHYYLDF